MKKYLLILIIITPLTSLAQIWYVGGKAGVTFANYKARTPWKEAANSGFTFGAAAFKQIKSNFGLGFELQYIQKGYYHKVCNTISDKLDANYLEIPIMVDYTFIFPALQNFKGHANVGFYTAYWLNGKYKMQGFDIASDDFDFKKSEARRFDFGPNVGGRLEYILPNASLSLEVRYEIGVLDLQKQVTDNTKNTNRAMILGLSYMKVLGI